MKNQRENIGVIVSLIIVACVIGLVVYLLMHNDKIANQEQSPENKILDNKIEIPTGKTSEATAENTIAPTNVMEKVSKNGDVLTMNYTGKLTNGTVFDSNVDPKFGHVEPFTFTLGAGQVIAGWDEGLVGMKVGDKKTLTIPPEKGYGNRAVSIIPANSTLIFDVELVDIK